MHHLFSEAGVLAITRLMQRRVLLAFDFDGTLAPIVASPDDAQVPVRLAHRMKALSQRRPVAILTGRRRADVFPRLGFEPDFMVGNHGAEGLNWLPTGSVMQEMRERLRRHAGQLQEAGVLVEDKGLSLALHFRLARDHDMAQRAIRQVTDGLPPELTAFGGKFVSNIVFSEAPDKGDAAIELLGTSGCESLLFIGDDLNDEAVFRRASPDWVTVRIGMGDETSSAMFFLETHAEMHEALGRILRALDQSVAFGRNGGLRQSGQP